MAKASIKGRIRAPSRRRLSKPKSIKTPRPNGPQKPQIGSNRALFWGLKGFPKGGAPIGKQVDKQTWVVQNFSRDLRVRKSSAECSRQPFWMPVNKCWACALIGLGNVQTIMSCIRSQKHPYPSHGSVRVPRAYGDQSIHGLTMVPLLFQEHTVTRASVPQPWLRSCSKSIR